MPQTISQVPQKQKLEQQCLEIALRLEEAMLPRFREDFTQLKTYNYFCSARALGKTSNLVLGVLALAIRRKQDVYCARKYANSLDDSLWRSFQHFIETLGLSDFFRFQISKNRITFMEKEPSFRVCWQFGGLANTLSFKGKERFRILWLEEAEQISPQDFQSIIPTLRDPQEAPLVLISSNIPALGPRSFLYQRFFLHPTENSAVFSYHFADNPILFPDDKAVDDWINSQRPWFADNSAAFRRAILGEWIEDPQRRLVPHITPMSELCASEFLVYSSQGGLSYLFGFRLTGGSLFVTQEDLLCSEEFRPQRALDPQGQDWSQIPLVLAREKEHLRRHFHQRGFVHSFLVDPWSLEELALYFQHHSLSVYQGASFALRELEAAEFDNSLEGSHPHLSNQVRSMSSGIILHALAVAAALRLS